MKTDSKRTRALSVAGNERFWQGRYRSNSKSLTEALTNRVSGALCSGTR